MTEHNVPNDYCSNLMGVNPHRVLKTRPRGMANLKRKAKKYIRRLRVSVRRVRQPDIISLFGVRIPVERKLWSEKNIQRLYDESYERDEREALFKTLRPTDCVLELGSGIGYMSTLAAKIVGDEQVTACEANPSLIPVISRTHALNGIEPEVLHGIMSCDTSVQSRTFYTQQHFSASSLHKPQGACEAKIVPVLHWQAELDRIQPTYLLMDIEGGEIELLESFDHATVQRMLIEFHPHLTGQASIDRVFNRLGAAGFSCARPHGGTSVWYFER